MRLSELSVVDLIQLSNQIDRFLSEKAINDSVKKDISNLMEKYKLSENQATVYALRKRKYSWNQIMHILSKNSPECVRVTYGKVDRRIKEQDRINAKTLYLDSPIYDLGLPANIHNALLKARYRPAIGQNNYVVCETISDLMDLTDEDILTIRGLGLKALSIIRKRLSELPPDIKWSYEA